MLLKVEFDSRYFRLKKTPFRNENNLFKRRRVFGTLFLVIVHFSGTRFFSLFAGRGAAHRA